ncbi:hypothetical protein DPMN_152232 [Dreissena polymorpha]|uniref:Apextrin C-terminal domain-containing protein n=1 Tax=Dreissena polymorpha TaxID=45954 RepID=A0A9D4FIJ4_DREPO|nr:hypothetical protein DPMN_152232 [Dreissena polymorpha]
MKIKLNKNAMSRCFLAGFQIGYLYWDDDDDSNKDGAGGTLPDGSYTENTGIYYCGRCATLIESFWFKFEFLLMH